VGRKVGSPVGCLVGGASGTASKRTRRLPILRWNGELEPQWDGKLKVPWEGESVAQSRASPLIEIFLAL
jgi:hypothetical protein